MATNSYAPSINSGLSNRSTRWPVWSKCWKYSGGTGNSNNNKWPSSRFLLHLHILSQQTTITWFRSPEMWCCVNGWVTPNVLKIRVPSLKGQAWPWIWRHYIPLKHHNYVPVKVALHPRRQILSNTSVGTQNLTSNSMQSSLVVSLHPLMIS